VAVTGNRAYCGLLSEREQLNGFLFRDVHSTFEVISDL